MTRLAAGERLTDLCREFGISRKTGSKFKARFERLGERGLEDRSRAPHVTPHRTPPELLQAILAERRQHPTWGAKKLKQVLETRLQRQLPSTTTISVALAKAGLVERRRRERHCTPTPTKLRQAMAPNDLWCIDYKGQFRLGDKSYCYPLTITDQFSRFVIACEGMAAISDEEARSVCHDAFVAQGLPEAMRSDNGVPFSSTGLAGLTKLSAFFVRVGIELERIRPAHPEENGRHERMHRTLKAETTRPARVNLLQQQERFDEWVHEFNFERPHEALEMKRPGDLFIASPRVMPKRLPDLEYPLHDDVLRVSKTGHIRIAGVGHFYLTSALAAECVGIREDAHRRWLITYAGLDLGVVDGRGPVVPISKIPMESRH